MNPYLFALRELVIVLVVFILCAWVGSHRWQVVIATLYAIYVLAQPLGGPR